MKLSRKKAIKLCIELWKWCAKTGKRKEYWPKWSKYGHVHAYCWFCEYVAQQLESCPHCPLVRKLGEKCGELFYIQWDNAKTPRKRKKYAKLFLEQIKKCV